MSLLWNPSWLPRWFSGKKKTACQCRNHRRWRFDPWVRKISWKRERVFQYSCLESPMDRRAWWTTAPGATKESDTTEHGCTQPPYKVNFVCIESCHFYFNLCFKLTLATLKSSMSGANTITIYFYSGSSQRRHLWLTIGFFPHWRFGDSDAQYCKFATPAHGGLGIFCFQLVDEERK